MPQQGVDTGLIAAEPLPTSTIFRSTRLTPPRKARSSGAKSTISSTTHTHGSTRKPSYSSSWPSLVQTICTRLVQICTRLAQLCTRLEHDLGREMCRAANRVPAIEKSGFFCRGKIRGPKIRGGFGGGRSNQNERHSRYAVLRLRAGLGTCSRRHQQIYQNNDRR